MGLLKSATFGATMWVTSRITTDATLNLRINRLGGGASLERFRINQILSILVGMIAAGCAAGLLSAQRGFSPWSPSSSSSAVASPDTSSTTGA